MCALLSLRSKDIEIIDFLGTKIVGKKAWKSKQTTYKIEGKLKPLNLGLLIPGFPKFTFYLSKFLILLTHKNQIKGFFIKGTGKIDFPSNDHLLRKKFVLI